jgi:hypothetical protein
MPRRRAISPADVQWFFSLAEIDQVELLREFTPADRTDHAARLLAASPPAEAPRLRRHLDRLLQRTI